MITRECQCHAIGRPSKPLIFRSRLPCHTCAWRKSRQITMQIHPVRSLLLRKSRHQAGFLRSRDLVPGLGISRKDLCEGTPEVVILRARRRDEKGGFLVETSRFVSNAPPDGVKRGESCTKTTKTIVSKIDPGASGASWMEASDFGPFSFLPPERFCCSCWEP